MILSPIELDSFLQALIADPHRLLGIHPYKKKQWVARAWIKDAVRCEVIRLDETGVVYELEQIHELGFFESVLKGVAEAFPYHLRAYYKDGTVHQSACPYAFLPTLSDEDLHYFGEGTHERIYEKLGGHLKLHQDVLGVAFAVWAPHATRVSVVGDFNQWDGRYHPMRMLGASGVWELFIPGLKAGTHYKYEIRTQAGDIVLKTDPYGMYFEGTPHHAAVVCDALSYTWQDSEWIAKRGGKNWHQEPISIYEVHHASWRSVVEEDRPLTYREMAHALADYVHDMGFTHVEFMPLAEHPYGGSWGYQVTGFFAPTHRFGTPDDFRYMVDVLHQKGIGVLMDWVPAHFPRDSFALAKFDGTCLYEHEDPRKGEHKDWGTLIFNYDRHEVRNFLLASALAWADRYHIDGMRVDAVASMLYLDYSREEGEWIPNPHGGRENIGALEFLRYANDRMHTLFPGTLMIAEESTSWSGVTRSTRDAGGLGFDFKWNMGWMHDTLKYLQMDPLFRKWHHNELTFGMLYQYTERFVQFFSHDEVVHGKGSLLNKMAGGSISEKARALRALYAYQWFWPGKKGLFMGQEWGQSAEWAYDRSLDWHLLQYMDHQGIQVLIKDLNHFYRNFPVLAERDHDAHGFEWVEVGDTSNSVYSFIRWGQSPEDALIVVANFTPQFHASYCLGVPFKGYWQEVINTDAEVYGGGGAGNLGGKNTQDGNSHNRQQFLDLTLPPMGVIVLKFQSQ